MPTTWRDEKRVRRYCPSQLPLRGREGQISDQTTHYSHQGPWCDGIGLRITAFGPRRLVRGRVQAMGPGKHLSQAFPQTDTNSCFPHGRESMGEVHALVMVSFPSWSDSIPKRKTPPKPPWGRGTRRAGASQWRCRPPRFRAKTIYRASNSLPQGAIAWWFASLWRGPTPQGLGVLLVGSSACGV
jgi:hypothetical protein